MPNITLQEAVRRDPTTPDLWIPYVLLGSGCVTFLAVHFWCYHKRNQNRYLLQREEKQLKSGLMEKRRIATLILAKHQTELDNNESSTDAELPETCSDNSMECSNVDPQCSRHNHQVCADVTWEDVPTCLTADMAAATASSSFSSEHWAQTSLGNAVPDFTTWPRLDENQTFLGSATKRCPRNINAVHSYGLGESSTSDAVHSYGLGESSTSDAVHSYGLGESSTSDAVHSYGLGESSTSATASPDEFVMNTCEPLLHGVNSRKRLPLLHVPNTAATTRRKIRRLGQISSEEVTVSGLRQPASSGHTSVVFYTDTSSDTQFSEISSFHSQPSLCLHSDNSAAERHMSSDDQHRASLTLNQWRDYQQNGSQEILLTLFSNYSDGTTSDNYGSETVT